MIETTSTITIIIPTYNRTKFLLRSIKYWQYSDFNVIVADGSREPTKCSLPARWIYLHDSQASILERWRNAIKLVKTPYVAICADDDFHGFIAVKKCVQFLEKNIEYTSAQGRYLFCKAQNINRISVGYEKCWKYEVSEVSADKRMLQSVTPYMHHIYAVHRTGNLLEAISGYRIELSNAFEVHLTIVGAIQGKHKTLPFFYSLRDQVEGSLSLIHI